jgi:hypothetical protein
MNQTNNEKDFTYEDLVYAIFEISTMMCANLPPIIDKNKIMKKVYRITKDKYCSDLEEDQIILDKIYENYMGEPYKYSDNK